VNTRIRFGLGKTAYPQMNDLTGRSLRLSIAFVAAVYAITWTACLLLRDAAAAGNIRAIWTFILVTVWSPTAVALAATALLGGTAAVRTLLRRLFRPVANARWYCIALLLPISVVLVAVLFSRMLHAEAAFLPPAELLPTALLQLATGAVGEELGWRGLLLPELQSRFSVPFAAVLMGIAWSLWHVPAFLFPYMPQQNVSAPAFLIAVASFGIFLAVVFQKTSGHVLATMLAHFSLNFALALGGARFSSTLWWLLAGAFLVIAIASGSTLRRTTRGA